MSRIPRGLISQFTGGDANLYWQSKRLDMGQSTLSSAVVYPLASSDVITRFREYRHLTKKQMTPGPCLLVMGALRPRCERGTNDYIKIEEQEASTEKTIIWRNRYQLTLKLNQETKITRNFLVKPLSLEFMKKNSSALRKSALLGQIYTFMSSTPSPFFVNYPLVLDEKDESKFSIPHLKFQSVNCDYEATVKFVGSHILMSKLHLD